MERHVSFVEGEFYHIYNRGVDGRNIFFSDGDWQHFLRLLYLRNTSKRIELDRVKKKPLSEITRGKTIVDICAYALMPNHFHLLIHEKQPGGITRFMRKLLTSYAMYMNTKYERTGPLMCRPFRSKHVDRNEYLQHLFVYISLNPLSQLEPGWKKGEIKDAKVAEEFMKTYDFGSYQDYFVSDREASLLLNKSVLPIDSSDLRGLHSLIKAHALGGS